MDYIKYGSIEFEEKKMETRIRNVRIVIDILREFELLDDELLEKLKDIDIQSELRLMQLQKEKEQREIENISIAKALIEENYLNKKLKKNEQFLLLKEIQDIFDRKNCQDKSGLKSWLVYFDFICEYGEKDKNDWITLTIRKEVDNDAS